MRRRVTSARSRPAGVAFETDADAVIETYLEVDAVHLPNLTAALRAERTDPDAPMDAIELLAARYRGHSTATSGLRTWLTAHGIPYRFTIV